MVWGPTHDKKVKKRMKKNYNLTTLATMVEKLERDNIDQLGKIRDYLKVLQETQKARDIAEEDTKNIQQISTPGRDLYIVRQPYEFNETVYNPGTIIALDSQTSKMEVDDTILTRTLGTAGFLQDFYDHGHIGIDAEGSIVELNNMGAFIKKQMDVRLPELADKIGVTFNVVNLSDAKDPIACK